MAICFRVAGSQKPGPGRETSLLPQNKMLPERIVCEGAFGEGFKDSIKFILHGLS